MKTHEVNLSAIVQHPIMRMDAEYHIGKQQGKLAYKKGEHGFLVEDDIAGKIMMFKADAEEYNTAKQMRDNLEIRMKELLP